ncbi:M23 family metallopeptidase [Chitinophaga sp. sic0106]|uniref:M23 family metallopeptidase n=1 Tax=Chitinophaga sp. sic0106 TaxID=2854785 RepID=UPI001C490BC4|nr:M23 family metallopeptidase [Chitinophaga sp. sic0106]MBV7529319.1 M23 family metallopeptidase [Chitinophaga sp. sic0106]
MIIYLLLGITLLLSFFSIRLIWKSGCRPLSASYSTLLAGLSLGVFLYLFGTWVYLTIYAGYAFGILILLTLGLIFFRNKKQQLPPVARWKVMLNLFFTGLLTVLSILYFTGTTGKPDVINLTFPFKKGNYFVLQGGKGLPTNLFHFSLRGAVYAMDIVKLNNFGGRADRIFSKKLNDYEIFGDTVYAPCDGRVVRAYGNNPDNIPPNMKRGPRNTNQVLLETPNSYIFMGHLRMNSVIVHEGQEVVTGQPLACIGNSGFSTEPHLHIQVHFKQPGIPWYLGYPLYIHFNGKGYLMNEVIRVR